MKKPVGVSNQVGQKTGCSATEDGQKLIILYLGSRGIILSMLQKQRS